MTPNPIRVIVADDDVLLRNMLVGLLEDLGYHVVAAVGDGRSAIDECIAQQPDVAILDHRMPGITGTEAAAELHRSVPHLPIVMLSAYDDRSLKQSAIETGVTRYLVKGCSAEDIIGALDELAQNHRHAIEIDI